MHSFVESNIEPSGHGFVEPDVTLGHLEDLRASEQFLAKSERLTRKKGVKLENNFYHFLLCNGLECNVELEQSCSYCHGVINVFLVIVHLGEYNWSESAKYKIK